MSLAFSSVARVPALHPSEQILDQFVPFSLDSTAAPAAELPSLPLSPATVACTSVCTRAPRCKRRVGSDQEGFDSGESDSGLNDSGRPLGQRPKRVGLGGVAPRQRSFWLVADAELIVYGATDPSARLTIGGEEVPLSTDGTFRIQVRRMVSRCTA